MGNVVHMENGRLASTGFEEVKQLVEAAIARGNVVIHFHGGLVSENSARDTAARLTPVYEEAGAAPIFVVWESGLFETIKNNFGELAREHLFRVVLKRVLSIAKRKLAQGLGDRAGGTIPSPDFTDDELALDAALDNDDASRLPAEPSIPQGLTELSEDESLILEEELGQDTELQEVLAGVSSGLRDPGAIAADEATRSAGPVIASTENLMDPAAVDRLIERQNEGDRGIFSALKVIKAVISVAARVIKRHIKHRDHGFQATVVEEILREFYVANIGGVIWEAMKKDTKDSFGSDPERFGGKAILKVLGDRLVAGATPRVTLVGHSTGAVYIGHLLEVAQFALPQGFKFDIVFLAPASTFELTVDTLVEYADRVRGFRMFTMTDANERNDKLVPVVYPHSLLYFVSGVVEPTADTPVVGMNRYYDAQRYEAEDFPKIEEFRCFVAGIPSGVVWSTATGAAGLETEALSHGDFDNDGKTLESLQSILREGFQGA